MSKAKKSRLSIVLALLFALLTIVCLAFLPRGEDSVLAEGSEGVLQVNYKVRKQTLKRGDTFSVELYVPESGNPGIVCLYLSVKNNSAGAFELTGVENKDVFDEKTLGEEVFVCGRLKGDYLDENSTVENSDNPFVISWDASLYGGKENPANVEKTGTLATLTYTVAAESYEIVDTLPVAVSLGQGNCYDKDKNLVTVTISPIEVTTYLPGDLRNGISGKAGAVIEVKALHRFQKAKTSKLIEIVGIDSPPIISPHHTPYQTIVLDHCLLTCLPVPLLSRP